MSLPATSNFLHCGEDELACSKQRFIQAGDKWIAVTQHAYLYVGYTHRVIGQLFLL
jgi:hypothetical protein